MHARVGCAKIRLCLCFPGGSKDAESSSGADPAEEQQRRREQQRPGATAPRGERPDRRGRAAAAHISSARVVGPQRSPGEGDRRREAVSCAMQEFRWRRRRASGFTARPRKRPIKCHVHTAE